MKLGYRWFVFTLDPPIIFGCLGLLLRNRVHIFWILFVDLSINSFILVYRLLTSRSLGRGVGVVVSSFCSILDHLNLRWASCSRILGGNRGVRWMFLQWRTVRNTHTWGLICCGSFGPSLFAFCGCLALPLLSFTGCGGTGFLHSSKARVFLSIKGTSKVMVTQETGEIIWSVWLRHIRIG